VPPRWQLDGKQQPQNVHANREPQYSIIAAFTENSNTFSIISDTTRAVVVEAIMSVLMEFIVVAIFIAAGLTTRKLPREMVKNGYADPPTYNNAASNKAPQEYPMAAAAPNQHNLAV